MGRPRILLVPALTALEWRIAATLAEWAEVATYDAPGVGDEPAVTPPTPAAVADRGLAEVDARGWESYVVVGDEFGCSTAVRLAAARPEAVRGMALGHACLEFRSSGPRAAVNGELLRAFNSLAETDYRTHVRHLTQITQGAYDDDLADAYMERVPQEISTAFRLPEEQLEPLIREVGAPLVLAKHEGCLLFTDEGYEDAAAAFPEARTCATPEKPSASPAFAQVLREFCETVG